MPVSIGSQQHLEELIAACSTPPTRLAAQSATPSLTSKDDTRASYMIEKKRLAEEKTAREVDLMRKAIARRVREAHSKRDRAAAERMEQIAYRQNTTINEIESTLRDQELKMENKKRELHNLWSEQVYCKIQKQLADRLGNLNSQELNGRLNDLFQKYIDTSDKHLVFRDIIIESEYDPLENKKFTISVDAEARSNKRWDGIVDPLCESIEKVLEIHDKGLLGQKEIGESSLPISHQSKYPGKDMLPVQEWLTGVIEATPHGFAAKLFDKETNVSPEVKEKKAARYKSCLNDRLDHYNYPTGSECVLAEMPKGKKCSVKPKDEIEHL